MAAAWFKTYPIPVLNEIIKILPDSILVMSGLMSLLTTSYALFVFFLSLLESIVGFYLFRKMVAQFDFAFTKHQKGFGTGDCKTGFSFTQSFTHSFAILGFNNSSHPTPL